MAGHSHWANIAHKKGLIDAKRGKLWSKLSRAIIIAAKHGGGDPTMNLKLRYAIDKAREVSMPKDNIERAIKKASVAPTLAERSANGAPIHVPKIAPPANVSTPAPGSASTATAI